jgi:carboxyl-terminal processing protease
LVGLAVCSSLGAVSWLSSHGPSEPTPSERPAEAVSAPSASPSESRAPDDARGLALPKGGPTLLSCRDAQQVVAFLQRELAAPPIAPTATELAELWAGMLDPHGMWSASPDSPVGGELLAAAPDMLASFADPARRCEGASRVADAWQPWADRLLGIYEAAFESARGQAPNDAELFQLAAEPIFEDDPVTRSGTELARELGWRLGSFAARFPDETALVEQARSRFFPTGSDVLRDIAVLAALRAYVPLVDPHGDFAPLDEEWALYAGDDTLDAGSPLWADVTRTPLGARVVDDPAPPLELDDLVLAIDGFSLAGASIDQIEQAARSAPERELSLRVLRQGEPQLLTLRVASAPASRDVTALGVERIPYARGRGTVLRIGIPDVTDDLGTELDEVLAREARGVDAVLLDLRGNGGGSLDAAVDSLSLFLPGARLFPLIHRGAVTEVLHADRPARGYTGPLAALVDGDTASAAEMLAGAIQAYGRGSLIGARTFGKGCVQEYFDEVVPSGVLRMTTLQFVMPSGAALQQIGLSPDLSLPMPPALERESQITRQPITYEGPDVREPKLIPGPAWPRDAGSAGPCQDPLVCTAISRLAGARAAARAARPRAGTR